MVSSCWVLVVLRLWPVGLFRLVSSLSCPLTSRIQLHDRHPSPHSGLFPPSCTVIDSKTAPLFWRALKLEPLPLNHVSAYTIIPCRCADMPFSLDSPELGGLQQRESGEGIGTKRRRRLHVWYYHKLGMCDTRDSFENLRRVLLQGQLGIESLAVGTMPMCRRIRL